MASNDSTANIWQGAIGLTSGGLGTPDLQQAASLASFSNSAQELADKIALAYSKVALAIDAEAVAPQPGEAVQERQSFLVTRVLAASPFILVIANLLVVALGIVLASIALGMSGGEVREIQVRPCIPGIVADRFEGRRGSHGVADIDEQFEEKDGNASMRIAIDREDERGYVYKVWPRYQNDWEFRLRTHLPSIYLIMIISYHKLVNIH